MQGKYNTKELLTLLRREKIVTWFDLGLYIDRFREQNELQERGKEQDFQHFTGNIRKGGLGFVTFHYMVDGVKIGRAHV